MNIGHQNHQKKRYVPEFAAEFLVHNILCKGGKSGIKVQLLGPVV
jgi:hypothetical protein